MDPGLADILKVGGGGSIGVLGLWLSFFLSGKLRDPKSVQSLETQLTKAEAVIDAKDSYIKELVTLQHEQNEEIRKNLFASITALGQNLSTLVMTKTIQSKEGN